MESEKGKVTVNIEMQKGKIRINHCCYTPDGGTWLSFPNEGRVAHYDLIEGNNYQIIFDISVSFGKNDRIEFVNPSFFKSSRFNYSWKKEEEENYHN